MIFLPIVERELRISARRPVTYWYRLAVALVGVGVFSWMMMTGFLRNPQTVGKSVFVALAVVSFIYSFLCGVLTAADTLSAEKREGTLGLLFLTDLKGYDIVLGKLTASSLNAFYGILALFPIMAVPMLAGGVTAGEFWRVIMVALNNAFFSLAVGMFASSVCRTERNSWAMTISVLALFTAGLPLIGALLTHGNLQEYPIFYIPNPIFTCGSAFDVSAGRGASAWYSFYSSLAVVHVLGWGFLLLACRIAPRSWQDKPTPAPPGQVGRRTGLIAVASPPSGQMNIAQPPVTNDGPEPRPLATLLTQWRYGSWDHRVLLRRLLLDRNPVCWLATRDRLPVISLWLSFAVLAVLWFWGLATWDRYWTFEGTYICTAVLLHALLKVMFAGEASKRLAQDHQTGALELVLGTSLSVRQILRGQCQALFRQFAAPAGLVLVLDFVFLKAGPNEWVWIGIFLAGMIVLLADLWALSWVGMWMGVRYRHPNRAAVAALVRIIVVPWVVFFLCITLGRLGISSKEEQLILVWLVINLLLDLAFGLRARTSLLTKLRQFVTERRRSPGLLGWITGR